MVRYTYSSVSTLCILVFAVLGPSCATSGENDGDGVNPDLFAPNFGPPPNENEILNINGIGPNEPITAGAVRALMAMPKEEARQKFISFSADINEAHIAAFSDDAVALSRIALVNPGWMREKDYRGRTPLCVAAKYGCANAARELIRQGVPINRRCVFDTPLIIAAKFGHEAVVRELLEAGAKVDAKSSYDNKTALGEAATFGFPDVVLELLAHGADPNSRDRNGSTPLIDAAGKWEPDCVDHLLRFGADVHAKTKYKFTALHRVNKPTLAKLLIEHGAPIDARNYAGDTPLHCVALAVSIPSAADEEERGRAFNLDLVAVAEFLVESGADPTIRNDSGQTPRDIAKKSTTPELVSLLKRAEGAWHMQDRGTEKREGN